MGTTAIGLTYSDTRGDGVTWADDYEANLTLITNYLRGYLKRVDTGAWEAPQTGVVYYAPPPYNLFAGARMQRFAGTGAGASITLMASGAAKPLAMFGCLQTGGPTGNYVAVNFSQTTANGSGLSVTKSTGVMYFERGTNVDDADDSWDVLAVYVPA